MQLLSCNQATNWLNLLRFLFLGHQELEKQTNRRHERTKTNRPTEEAGVVRDLLVVRVSQPPELLVDLLLNENCPINQYGKET